ncbi:MAG: endosialidase [Lachnospiraceae bacterium]|nr:endosialidase [Lachnospiraceae bacterium]
MSVIDELIRKEGDGTISFGNYTLDTKTKLPDFEVNGDLYKVKTFKEITKLEKNGMFVYESVPGTAVHNFSMTEDKVEFKVEAEEEPQITVELESETEYTIYLDGLNAGKMKTNLGGKLVLSVEISNGASADVKIVKC